MRFRGDALRDVAGVRDVEVSLEEERATVVGEGDVPDAALVGAVEAAGYAVASDRHVAAALSRPDR